MLPAAIAELCPSCGRLLLVGVPLALIREAAGLPSGDPEENTLCDLETLTALNDLAASGEADQVVVTDGRIAQRAVCRCGLVYGDLQELASLQVLREALA